MCGLGHSACSGALAQDVGNMLKTLKERIDRVVGRLLVLVGVDVKEEWVHVTRLLYEVEDVVCLLILLIQAEELLLM